MKNKTKINRLRLWIIVGLAWIIPQVFILFIPDYSWIKLIIFLLLGWFILFDKDLDKILLKKDGTEFK